MYAQYAREDDGRGRFPASVKVDVSRETPARLRAAARARGTTVAVFVREAIDSALTSQVDQAQPAPEERAA